MIIQGISELKSSPSFKMAQLNREILPTARQMAMALNKRFQATPERFYVKPRFPHQVIATRSDPLNLTPDPHRKGFYLVQRFRSSGGRYTEVDIAHRLKDRPDEYVVEPLGWKNSILLRSSNN